MKPDDRVRLTSKGAAVVAFIDAGLAPEVTLENGESGWNLEGFEEFWLRYEKMLSKDMQEPVQSRRLSCKVSAEEKGEQGDGDLDTQLPPRPPRILTIPFILRLLLRGFLSFILGFLLFVVFKG